MLCKSPSVPGLNNLNFIIHQCSPVKVKYFFYAEYVYHGFKRLRHGFVVKFFFSHNTGLNVWRLPGDQFHVIKYAAVRQNCTTTSETLLRTVFMNDNHSPRINRRILKYMRIPRPSKTMEWIDYLINIKRSNPGLYRPYQQNHGVQLMSTVV